jgi:hypothetical protein
MQKDPVQRHAQTTTASPQVLNVSTVHTKQYFTVLLGDRWVIEGTIARGEPAKHKIALFETELQRLRQQTARTKSHTSHLFNIYVAVRWIKRDEATKRWHHCAREGSVTDATKHLHGTHHVKT